MLFEYHLRCVADDVAMIKTFYDMFVEKAPFEKFVETLAAMKSVNAH